MNKQTGALETGEQKSSTSWGGFLILAQLIGASTILASVVIFVIATLMNGSPSLLIEDAFGLANVGVVLAIGLVLFFLGTIGQHESS